MPVRKDENGYRYVEAQVEVPGTPEEVWRAIATGDGISSWFVPSTVEERVGGKALCSFGPGMDAVSKITKWNPPQSYTSEAEAEPGEAGPGKVATEWIVEARGGGTCVVRVVHRWFAETDDWDGQFEGHAYGWATSFFRMLRIYLTHFAGQECSAFDLAAFSKAPPPETWRTFKSALTIDEQTRRAASTPGAPELSGAVEHVEITDPELLRVRETSPQIVAALEGMGDEDPELLLRLDRPAPGIAHMFVMSLGDQTMVSIRFYLYGDRGAAAAAEAQRQWSDWLAERFPQEASG
jgi:uncharacterized protein YndB with AHSA1/START domain